MLHCHASGKAELPIYRFNWAEEMLEDVYLHFSVYYVPFFGFQFFQHLSRYTSGPLLAISMHFIPIFVAIVI